MSLCCAIPHPNQSDSPSQRVTANPYVCQIMIAFKDFIEDYNTATMPHDKYYNLEAWEMNEYRKAQLQKVNKTGILLYVRRSYLVYNDGFLKLSVF